MIDWLRRAEPEIALGDRVLPIEVRRNKRARRLTMRLARDGSAVRLTLPPWAPTGDAIAFAHAKAAWLADQLDKLPRACPPRPGGWLGYRGADLHVVWDKAAPRRPVLDEAAGAIRIGGPLDAMPGRLGRWLEQQALAISAQDLADYAERAGVPLPELRLSRAKSRWGSCSGKQVVRINWRLVQAPDHVRRSVIAHEVAHLVHFDHSPAFHALLARIFEHDIAQSDRWLKEHGRSLYAAFG